MSTAKERLTGISGVQVNGNTVNHHFNRSFGSQATTTTTTTKTTTSKTELTSAINSIIGLNAFTKGGAAKRVFKPTIPTTRRSGGSGVTPGSGGTGGGNGNREGRDQNNSCNGKVKSKEKTRKQKGKKDLIQLDATFNGINITSNSIKPEKGFISPGGSGYGQTSDTRTLRSSQSDSLKGIGSSGTSGGSGSGGSVSLNGCFVKLENSESSYGDNNPKGDHYHKKEDGDDEVVEEDVEKIQRVLYRDDFVPLYDPNEQDMTPIGWEHVSQHQAFKQEECPMGEDGSIDEAVNYLNDVHNQCLKMFVLTAFDMTRYMMITPKRIAYAKQKEQQLFEALMVIANKKQEEIKNLITSTITSMKDDILNQESSVTGSNLVESVEKKFNETNSTLNLSLSSNESTAATTTTTNLSSREVQLVMIEIQDVVLNKLNAAIADKLIGSVDYLRSSYIGTLERCLGSLENWSPHCDILSPPPPPPPPLPLQGSLPTTTTAISSSVSSISQSRGQSQSSPSSLTSSAFPLSLSKNECIQASNALKQILNAAYQVEINMRTSSSLLRAFWDKMKQLVSISLSWRNQTVINDEWKRKVAIDVLSSLSESRLAKSICAQFKERLRKSHTQFATAMKQLENLHYGRLEKIEELRDRVRKYYAPRIARCALEATSLRDVILHGMPELGREIGRGQYGVVYSCNSWAGYAPVAVKSVVPPDEKHWNDLAMEFYYTRSIPKHNRIVQIRGSVIDYSYGNGSNPAVLLIMDRLSRDLYSAIKNGLDWLSRLQVAIDVVQGIRFLHSQGLVHRDIKLKNVLLDKRNRAKITDLGFCKPEAMMSGSIVGTPIHMAPELFTGKYDNSVDVYAFGILFWYICAGHVRLPFIFEQCQNKDQLWTCVRKGLRPERIPEFDSECWAIMEACWVKDPSARPYLGDIELKLVTILKRKTEKQSNRNKVERNEY